MDRHEVINGFRIPKGYSGVAVRRATEMVLKNPGIPQAELLQDAVRYAGLNPSTAGWITSPGNPWNGKSPATRIWDRRKESVFKCYPNEHTEHCLGAEAALRTQVQLDVRKQLSFVPKGVDLGGLVQITDPTMTVLPGVGFYLLTGIGIRYRYQIYESASFRNIGELLDSLQTSEVQCHPVVILTLTSDAGSYEIMTSWLKSSANGA